MKIKLAKPFASNSPVDEFDARQIKKALNRLGYYHPRAETGITGIPDLAVFDALKKFQKDRGLSASGAVKPEDKTVDALNAAIEVNPRGDISGVRRATIACVNRTRRWKARCETGTTIPTRVMNICAVAGRRR